MDSHVFRNPRHALWNPGRFFNQCVGCRRQRRSSDRALDRCRMAGGPNPASSRAGQLFAVTRIPNTNQLWAVGQSSAGLGYRTLIERWDGTKWAIIPSPNPTITDYEHDYLTGVAASSRTNAWAIGYYVDSAGAQFSYSEHWNGKVWTVVWMQPWKRQRQWGNAAQGYRSRTRHGDVLGGRGVCDSVPIRAARRTVERHVDGCDYSRYFGECVAQRRRCNLARERLGGRSEPDPTTQR